MDPMTEQLTLELPEELARRAREFAAASHRRVEDAIVEWIDRAVSEHDISRLSDDQIKDLCGLTLDDAEQQQLSLLLEKQREQEIDSLESQRLDLLMDNYQRGLLLKARALKEAVKRGLKSRLDDHAA
jgi:hypothetical protein